MQQRILNLHLTTAMLAIAICLCTPATIAAESAAPPSPQLPANIIRLPLTRQATDYTCGVAALQSVLAFWGDEHREDELSRLLKAGKVHGTAYRRMEKYARDHGYDVETRKNMSIDDLKHELDKRLPVIVLIQAWPTKPVDFSRDWVDGHYVVAIGYDGQIIYFMDPSTLGNYTYIPTQQFIERWHDTDLKEKLRHFGMIVSREKSSYEPDAVKLMQ
jgi:predicted double-glycine peptidase